MNVGGVAPTWSEAFPVEGAENWRASPWFGNLDLNEDSGWLMHEGVGLVICHRDIRRGGDLALAGRFGLDVDPFLHLSIPLPHPVTGSWLFFHGQGATKAFAFLITAKISG